MSAIRIAKRELRPFFTPKGLAEYLSISERTVRDMLSKQRIPSYKVEGQRRIDPADVEAYLARKRSRQAMMRLPSDQRGEQWPSAVRGRFRASTRPEGGSGSPAPTDPTGKRHYRGTLKLKREAQDAIDAAYEEWETTPVARDTVGDVCSRLDGAASALGAHRLRPKQQAAAGARREGRWPPAARLAVRELHRSHAHDLVDYMLRHQRRAAAGASAVLRVLSAMTEDAIDDRCATVNPFKGVRLRAGDPRVIKRPARRASGRWTQMHEFAAAAGNRNEPMIRMLSDCGMRVGEMLALRRALQDLKAGIFRVRGTAWNGVVIESSRERTTTEKGRFRRAPWPCFARCRRGSTSSGCSGLPAAHIRAGRGSTGHPTTSLSANSRR